MNLAQATGTAASNLTVLEDTLGRGDPLLGSSIEVGAPMPFGKTTGGSNTFTFSKGHAAVVSGCAATLDLQADTLAIVPTSVASGFRPIDIPRGFPRAAPRS